MRKASAIGNLGLGLDRTLGILDERSRSRPRGEQRLVGVSHATAQSDGSHQCNDNHEPATAATGFLVVLWHIFVELGLRLAVAVRSCGKGWRVELAAIGAVPLPWRRHVVAEIEATCIALLAPRWSGRRLVLGGRVREAKGRRIAALWRIAKVGTTLASRRKAIERQGVCTRGVLRCLRGKACAPVSFCSLRKVVALRRGCCIARLLMSALARCLTIGRWPMRRWLRHRLCRQVVRLRTTCCRPHPRLPDRTAPRHVRNPPISYPSTLRRLATLSHLLGGVYANNRQARGQNLCIGADERQTRSSQFPVMRLDKAQMWRFIAFRPLRVES